MTPNLWASNHPRNFWQCQSNLSDDLWKEAITKALPVLGLPIVQTDIDSVLALVLGEERFGPDHWELGPLLKFYYKIKCILPRSITRPLRRFYHRGAETQDVWPIESRYVNFLWKVMQLILQQGGYKEILFKSFWPIHSRFAFVLTHDIETAAGQEFVETVAGLEEELGFHSLFNFVPERYKLDYKLMENLRQRGFEIGVHGLKHDGRLFDSKAAFMKKANQINGYLKEWDATGFRAELTHRQPEWMQALKLEYDLSFFDTDPFEPIPGGTMSIWPFFIGHFVELPYTLVQDYTLISVLGEKSTRIWLEKVDFIENYHGMVLLNTHPDYLKSKSTWNLYYGFLSAMKQRDCYWHATPGEVARWWKSRMMFSPEINISQVDFSKVYIKEESLVIEA